MTTQQNPFIYGGITPRMYGRTKELQIVLDNLHNLPSFSIVGAVRMGKSTFLWHLAQQLRNAKLTFNSNTWRVVPIYIDLQQWPDIDAKYFWRILYRRLHSDLERFGIKLDIDGPTPNNPDPNSYFRYVQHLLDTLSHQKIVLTLLLDEFDEILIDPAFDRSHLDQLRYLANSGGNLLSLFVSTKKELLTLTYDPEKLASPFFNIFRMIRLGLMGENEIRDLVAKSLKYCNASPGFFREADINLAIDIAGRNPFYIQLFCNIFFDYRKNKRVELNTTDLSIVLEQFQDNAEPFYMYQWSKIDEQERKLIRHLINGNPHADQDKISSAENLVNEGLLVRSDNGNLQLYSKGFKRFVTEDPPPEPLLATSIKSAFETELIEAKEQSYDLLPPMHTLELPGISLSHKIIQASTISSDFYNFIHREDGSLVVYMLDVVGHGFAASNQVRSIFQLLTDRPWGMGKASKELAKVDEWVSKSFILQKEKVAFCMSFIVIDPLNMVINFANSGMPYPILVRRGKTEPIIIKASGMYLGEGYNRYSVQPREVQVDIEEGDLLIMVSDGIIEATDTEGQFFGRNGLFQSVLDTEEETPEQIANSIIKTLEKHTGYRENPQDDQALVVISIRKPYRVFTLENNKNILDLCVTKIEEDVCKWLRKCSSIDTKKCNRIWRATWEALLNSIQHGSKLGDILSIEFHQRKKFFEILVKQTQKWEHGTELVEKIKSMLNKQAIEINNNPYFGLTIMLSLTYNLSIHDSGRTVVLRFLLDNET